MRPRELREARVSPRKSLGQHFLRDYSVIGRIVDAVDPAPDETIIEVGPGLGVLTERLAEVCKRLIAVEIDSGLALRLKDLFSDRGNVSVLEHDVLKVSPTAVLAQAGGSSEAPYVVVGNLPYSAGAAIVRHFLEAERPPSRIIVMLQREVADSIVAAPGKMSLLGTSVQVYAQARKLFNVPPRAFYPAPKVTSSVIRLDLLEQPLIEPEQREHFFRVVRAGFSAPRKQLRNTLAQGLGIRALEANDMILAAGLAPTLRPQDVALQGWLALASNAPRQVGQ